MSAQPLPAWALRPATAHDRSRVEQARARGTLSIAWPEGSTLRAWAKQHGWPAPRRGFQAAFLARMLESEETFALALRESGMRLALPVERHVVPPDDLLALDALYAARDAGGRPSDWGALVEALRALRRAVEAGVEVEIDGCSCRDWGSFYTWAHGRYHMLEDGFDRWIGDDRP